MNVEKLVFVITGMMVLIICFAGLWLTHQTVPTTTPKLKVMALKYFTIFALIGLAVVYMMFVYGLQHV